MISLCIFLQDTLYSPPPFSDVNKEINPLYFVKYLFYFFLIINFSRSGCEFSFVDIVGGFFFFKSRSFVGYCVYFHLDLKLTLSQFSLSLLPLLLSFLASLGKRAKKKPKGTSGQKEKTAERAVAENESRKVEPRSAPPPPASETVA